MEDDIYGDLEVSSSSSSSSSLSTSSSSTSASSNNKKKQGKKESESQPERIHLTSLAGNDGSDHTTVQEKLASKSSPKKSRQKDEDDGLDSMDLMDEGLTNKFKETAKNKMRNPDRNRPPPTRVNHIQVEKLKHEIGLLKKANHQLEINLALLYKSSHHIITLKDKELSKLKSKYDALCFRRKLAQDCAKPLPSIVPQMPGNYEPHSAPQVPRQPDHSQKVTPFVFVDSRQSMREELDTLRNYLPKHSQRAVSESSSKSQESTGQGSERKKSSEFEESRLCKENNERCYNSKNDKRKDSHRRSTSHSDRPPRRDSRDRRERDKHPQRDSYGKNQREQKAVVNRREERLSQEISYRRNGKHGDTGDSNRKRKVEQETENSKRQRTNERKTRERICRLVSTKTEKDEAKISDGRSLSRSERHFRRTVSPQMKNRRTSPKTEARANATKEDDSKKPSVYEESSVEFHVKTRVSQNQSPEYEQLKEDGEISESESESLLQKVQELCRSPRKSARTTNASTRRRATSLESKSKAEERRVRSRSFQRHSSPSTKLCNKQKSPHKNKVSQEVDCHKSRDVGNLNLSAQKPSREPKTRKGSSTIPRAPLEKKSPTHKLSRSSENEKGVAGCTTPTARRSPRKLIPDHSEGLVMKNPNFSHISPTSSESPKAQSILRGHPCKIPSRMTDETEDPRNPKKVNEMQLFLAIPRYLVQESEETNSQYNTEQELYKNNRGRQLETEIIELVNTPQRRSPRKKPRPLTGCPADGADSPASVQLPCDFSFLDQVPLRTRTSLNSDNDKPLTPTLSPTSSSVTPTGSNSRLIGQQVLLHRETFEWHEAHFTPLDTSTVPETPGKEYDGTPLMTAVKNGRTADDVGRTLYFDKVT
ncbi:eukaryotic translation initiation factor 5B-like [Varroa destructor]|uniref:Uncharacterized protein n=1 Tax=Varroa destructor TaxID=109461 RepID=A0A7M7JGL8_VARDE|nr:eukaryotic translation initiation factor 5B-like [Varroa destructor]XP_022651831.1 eukaryotic translation initiation factor 5B-like [Varroa destructor]XP_022651832.1 eukaryotic translation initiation factor 5B-like [Varroa destructor]XP_022651833.1 eukaryotic translation initiation factor 5B-like [Varroa destructor]